MDFVEVVESVAYALCGEDNVQFDQFCMIFRTKNVCKVVIFVFILRNKGMSDK